MATTKGTKGAAKTSKGKSPAKPRKSGWPLKKDGEKAGVKKPSKKKVPVK